MMVVLDASAMLALLLEESGADVVARHVRTAEISVVNLAEVFTVLVEGGVSINTADQVILGYGTRIRTFREAHAMEVARLRPLTKHLGLSLGDRACLAQGRLSDRPVMTADRRMAEADLGLDIRLIR